MKKIIMGLTVIASVNCLHGMDTTIAMYAVSQHPYPKIVVVRDDLYNRKTAKADITVVGMTEQRKLMNSPMHRRNIGECVGDVKCCRDDIVLARKKVFAKYCVSSSGFKATSASIIVEGKRFDLEDAHLHLKNRLLDGLVVHVVEPQVERHERYYEEASKKAQKGLGICYKNVLEEAYKSFTSEHQEKSIAFPPLSTLLGLPKDKAAKVAVAAVAEFIKNSANKNAYNVIEFVVSQQDDYDLYSELLDYLFSQKEVASDQ